MSEAVVFLVMDCSTVHLRLETLQAIRDEHVGHLLYPNPYGAFCWVPDEADFGEIDEETVPQDLIDVLRFARKESCDWIKFDCDGTEYDELPKYEHEGTAGISQPELSVVQAAA